MTDSRGLESFGGGAVYARAAARATWVAAGFVGFPPPGALIGARKVLASKPDTTGPTAKSLRDSSGFYRNRAMDAARTLLLLRLISPWTL